jgi:hypothetical protein
MNHTILQPHYYLYKNQPNPSISTGESDQTLEELNKEIKDNGF